MPERDVNPQKWFGQLTRAKLQAGPQSGRLADVTEDSSASTLPTAPDPLETAVADTQRSGSLTGMGILLGFSLTFIGQWSIGPGSWSWYSAAVVLIAGVGIYQQLRALFAVLWLPPLSVEAHKTAVRRFRIGVTLTLLAFGLHVVLDVLTDKKILNLASSSSLNFRIVYTNVTAEGSYIRFGSAGHMSTQSVDIVLSHRPSTSSLQPRQTRSARRVRVNLN
jgi:hypothetical protein